MIAEIISALKTVVSTLSYNWNNDISDCFCTSFPNNVTAEQFALGRTKSTLFVNHGLSCSWYFQELLTEHVNLCDCFMICFDESFCFVKQLYEMDIFIHYWNTQTQNLRVCYSGLEFLGHYTNHGLLNKIEGVTSMLNMQNLKQLLIDCPKVNLKFLSALQEKSDPNNILVYLHVLLSPCRFISFLIFFFLLLSLKTFERHIKISARDFEICYGEWQLR